MERQIFSRRQFLNLLLGGSAAALAGAILYPLVRYIMPPKEMEEAATSAAAAKVGELAPNSAKIFRFGQKPAILINTPKGELKAFSAVCTHLNCTVQYEKDSSIIWCACHNGKFDLNGRVISGPPPKALEEYSVSLRGDEVIVARKG